MSVTASFLQDESERHNYYYGEYDPSSGGVTVLFPHADELKLDIRLKQATYRPGEQAVAELRGKWAGKHGLRGSLGRAGVRPGGGGVGETRGAGRESRGRVGCAPGICRGNAGRGNSDSAGGVTLQDLMHLDLTKPVPKGYELAAKLLLNSNGEPRRIAEGSDSYPRSLENEFRIPIGAR